METAVLLKCLKDFFSSESVYEYGKREGAFNSKSRTKSTHMMCIPHRSFNIGNTLLKTLKCFCLKRQGFNRTNYYSALNFGRRKKKKGINFVHVSSLHAYSYPFSSGTCKFPQKQQNVLNMKKKNVLHTKKFVSFLFSISFKCVLFCWDNQS